MSHNMTSICQSYFGLTDAPFSIAPDPRYLFMSQGHQEALATLLFGLDGDGGFVLLTGDVGAGKTTICRSLLERIPDNCDVAYIFNPRLTVIELLSSICDEFGIAYPAGNTSIKLFVDAINAYLLDAHAKGRRAVLIIDEAQNLFFDVLEQMRLLTNLETDRRKLLQIILLGQPELATMLDEPELRQLAQRVVARYHLGPLSRDEIGHYVRHRLEVSGAKRTLFPDSLMGRLHRLSGGVPRVINTLCDRALLGAYVQGKDHVDRATLNAAAREVLPRQSMRRWRPGFAMAASLVLLAGGAAAAWLYRQAPAVPTAVAAVQPIRAAPEPADPAPVGPPNVAPALSPVLEWPADRPLADSRALALGVLLRTWNVAYRDGDDTCRQAASAGLVCKDGRGGLDELRAFNRPAMLQMQDRSGRTFYATLTGLGAKSATFAVGGRTETVSMGALAAQWSGYYKLLWRPAPFENRSVVPGDRGPAVRWLDTQLAEQAVGASEPIGAAAYDHRLALRVRQFQLAQGLVPDGIAGPRTLSRLGSVNDRSAPRLSATGG